MSKSLPGLREQQLRKACKAILKYIEGQKSDTDLLEDDEFIFLTIALMKIPQAQKKDKPIRLSLQHPIYQFEGAEICLIVKDHKGEGHKEAKIRVKKEQTAGVTKVIGLSKLRTKFESHEAKRQLCASYDLFLADQRIIPSLPKLIGKTFFRKKKQPIPVDLTKKDWGAQVKAATQCTYMFPPQGNSLSIKIAKSSFSIEECAANALQALSQAIEHLPKKWAGVRAVFVKSADSLALPVFQRLPQDSEELETASDQQ